MQFDFSCQYGVSLVPGSRGSFRAPASFAIIALFVLPVVVGVGRCYRRDTQHFLILMLRFAALERYRYRYAASFAEAPRKTCDYMIKKGQG
jgi:hypothetical protein